MLKIKLPQEGKNITLQVTGSLDGELGLTPILDIKALKTPAVGIRLDSATWLIQEKMGLILWWKKDDLLLPLESRGSIRLDVGIYNSVGEDWDGIIRLSSFGYSSNTFKPKYFHLTLDIDRL